MTMQSQTGKGGLEARPPDPAPARTPAEIEAEIERTRARLAGTVNAIASRVKPANVARRTAVSARSKVIDERGNLRTARVAAAAIGVLAVAGFMTWRRAR
ncbi:MAG: DUF3618 domain-containing protein [Actinomycetes bacterium]